MVTKKYYIPFEPLGIDVPIVKIKIQDNEVYALVDTGCEDAMFSDTLKELAMEWNDVDVNIVSFNNELPVNKMATFQVHFNGDGYGIVCPIKGYVSDMSTLSSIVSGRVGDDIEISAIIGSVFLNKLNCKIDYKSQRLVLQ